MINPALAPLLLDAESQREEAAIKAAYETGRQDGRSQALSAARMRVSARDRALHPAYNADAPYRQGLLMAINDICDLAAGGRLTEEENHED